MVLGGPMNVTALPVLAALIGVVIWALVRTVKALNAGRSNTDPTNAGRLTRSEPGGPRRPMLTVASELAAIAGLLIAFIALMKN